MPISVEYVNQLRQLLSLANVEILPKTNRSIIIIIMIIIALCGALWSLVLLLHYAVVTSGVCVAWDYFKLEHYVLNLPLVALLLPLLLLATLNLYWLRAKGNVGHKKQFILEIRLPTLYVYVCVGSRARGRS